MSASTSEPVIRTLRTYSRLLERGLAHVPPSKSTKFLLERFHNPQLHVLNEFKRAETEESLSRAQSLVEALLDTHIEMWKASVEHGSLDTLNLLRQLLQDVFQFREYEYAPPPLDASFDELPPDELSTDQRKQALADDYRSSIEHLRFAVYGWGIHLYTEGDLSSSFCQGLLEGPVIEEFSSINDLSDVFFRIRETEPIFGFWEEWNMNRELDRKFGVATTGMAANTWLLKFYCSTLIWMLCTDSGTDLDTVEPMDNPALDYADRSIHLDPIIDTIEAFKDDYPLSELVENREIIEGYCDQLIQYFGEVREIFKDQERDWTRDQPIEDGIISRFSEKVNSQLKSNQFRTSIKNTNGISEDPSLSEGDGFQFPTEGRLPRRLFVDTGISTFFTNNFSEVISDYRRFVLDQLIFETHQVSSYNELPSVLDESTSDNDIRVIVTGDREAANVIRDHERSNRISNQELNSYLEFSNTPVLNDITNDYLAIAWLDQSFDYIEKSVDNPLIVDVIPGEKVPEWNDSEVPDDFVPEDWVKVTFLYIAEIYSSKQNGIIFQM